jgi:cytochrome P450
VEAEVSVAAAIGGERLPPGPRGSVVQMLRYARDPLGFYADCARRFGDVFTVPTVLGPLVVCGDPEGVRSIFALPPGSFSRWSTDAVSPLLGEASLLLSGGARHARDRKLLTPPFHGERMRAYGSVIRAAALREATRWTPGSVFSMQEAGSAISIDVILRAVFGVDEAASLDELRAALLGALASMSPLLMLFPALRRRFGGIGPYARMLAVRDRLDARIYAAIARRRAGGGDGGDDILNLMLSARYDDGGAMSDHEIRDQLLTLVFAGHETSGIALAWAVNWLARTPPVRDRLLAELSALGDDPTPAALAAAPYLEAVCYETLRLYPVVGEVVRLLRAPMPLGAWTIPAGVPVSAGIALVHARADLYSEPAAFRPERFLEGRKLAPHEYLPFGGGARRCIGAAFALYEMKVVLGTLLARYRFTLARKEPERPVMRNLAMGPKGRVRLTALDRSASEDHDEAAAPAISSRALSRAAAIRARDP